MKEAMWGSISAWDLWQCLLLRTDCHILAPVALPWDPSLFILLEELMMKVAALVSSHLQNLRETPTPNWAPHLKQSTVEQQVKVGNYRTGLKVNTIILLRKGFSWPSVKIIQLIILHLRITYMFPHLCKSVSTDILDHCSLNFGPVCNCRPLTFLTEPYHLYGLVIAWGMSWIYSKWREKRIATRWHVGQCYLHASQGPLTYH